MVKFVSAGELRDAPASVWDALNAGEDVAIVADGEPRAVMLRIDDGDVEAAMELVRTVRMQRAIARIRAAAAARGLDRMSDDEINAEIAAARAERNARR